VDDYHAIQHELSAYSEALATRPQVVAGSKAELPGTEERRGVLAEFCKERGIAFHTISSVTGLGLEGLVRDVAARCRSAEWVPAAP